MRGMNERLSKAVTKMIESLQDSHGGYEGKSLVEKLQDELDEVINDTRTETWSSDNLIYREGLEDGLAHALGVIRSSSREAELEAAEQRYCRHKTPEDNYRDGLTGRVPQQVEEERYENVRNNELN